jgi:hypothetical protein
MPADSSRRMSRAEPRWAAPPTPLRAEALSPIPSSPAPSRNSSYDNLSQLSSAVGRHADVQLAPGAPYAPRVHARKLDPTVRQLDVWDI